jgi:DNA-binding MarR family transcriptional regulator
MRSAALGVLIMTDDTFELISLIERLHRRLLQTLKLEIDALGVLDINNVQTIMLFQIGDADVTIGELAQRSSNLLSNVSYNVKKLVDNGYLVQKRSKHDRRTIFVRSTQKSRSLCRQLSKAHTRYMSALHDPAIHKTEMQQLTLALRKLDSFWINAAELARRTAMRQRRTVEAPAGAYGRS